MKPQSKDETTNGSDALNRRYLISEREEEQGKSFGHGATSPDELDEPHPKKKGSEE